MSRPELYPLRFYPLLKERIWGGKKLHTFLGKSLNGQDNIGESWEVSGVKNSLSVVANGVFEGRTLVELVEAYRGKLLGNRVLARFGKEFPLLVKFIDAREDLSIQVHPGDALARERHGSAGKTEMWYVVQADEGAKLVSGFTGEVTPAIYLDALQRNSVESLMATHPVKAGDVFYIPAGRVHAIGAGIVIAEIQQTSDITYRIYDFNRVDSNGIGRELHTDLALDAIDFKCHDSYVTRFMPQVNKPLELVKSPYFVTNLIEANKQVIRDYSGLDSFVVLVCVGGNATLVFMEQEHMRLRAGDTILVPASINALSINPLPGVKVLETFIPG